MEISMNQIPKKTKGNNLIEFSLHVVEYDFISINHSSFICWQFSSSIGFRSLFLCSFPFSGEKWRCQNTNLKTYYIYDFPHFSPFFVHFIKWQIIVIIANVMRSQCNYLLTLLEIKWQ